jgi:peptidyl-prolyl cis-trans isomerase SurA
MLEQIIQQRLVQVHLRRLDKLASRETVDSALQKQEDRLSAQKRTLDDVLAARGISMPEYRRDLRWELSWKKFAAEEIADEQLEAYFKEHQRHYDGSQVQASHILLRPVHGEDLREVAQMISRARTLREQITAGKISFADAAKAHSDGPSASQGGDLGFFPRKGVNVESFARAAYDLKRGDVSQPVVTQFGVHLIQVTNVRPGTRTWTHSREQLQTAVANDLFRQLADEERQQTPVAYSGKIAHLDPETGAVVQAGAKQAK